MDEARCAVGHSDTLVASDRSAAYRCDVSVRYIEPRTSGGTGGEAPCSIWPSSVSCTSPRCTATSSASSSPPSSGTFRAAISYGSLYPTLRRLQASGYITEGEATEVAPLLTGRRGRVVYTITAEGKERFQQLLGSAGPETYDSEATFGVHFAFFARTDRATRLRILEGRRRRVEERREGLREVDDAAPPSASTHTPSSSSATAWTPPSARSGGWRS